MKSDALLKAARSVPLVRGLTYRTPPYFTGSLLENRLGLQVLRSCGKHVAWRLRRAERVPAHLQSEADVLARDGVLVIPDFLPGPQFQAVLEEYRRVRDELVFRNFQNAERARLQVASLGVAADDARFPRTLEALQNSPRLGKLAQTVMRRPISSPPQLTFNVYRLTDPQADDNDIENILHADLHTPTAKAFYYLDDVDQSNGAFVYARGSHRLTAARLRHEYDISVRTAKLNRGNGDIRSSLLVTRAGRERNIVSPTAIHRMGIQESPICGRANTLVLADNMGFHRRGEFTSGRSRETLLINFRHLERCFL